MSMIFVLEPGDWIETLVVRSVARNEAMALAERATSFLVEEGAIEAAIWRNTLGPLGHGAGPKAALIHEPSEQTQYGLVSIVASGEGIMVMGKRGPILANCPSCRTRQGFTAIILDAWEKDAEASAECRTCRRAASLVEWDGKGEFAFARLAVTFNHWPRLTSDFKIRLARTLDDRGIDTLHARGPSND